MIGLPDILATGMVAWVIDAWDIGLSIGLLATVFLLVLTLLGQEGQPQLSPQREAALATGHTDRRTVFENTFIGKFMWLLLSFCHRLAIPRAKAWIDRKLVAAGSPNYYTAEEYLAVALLTGLVIGLFLDAFVFLIESQISLFALGFGIVMGMGLTLYQLHDHASKRLRVIWRRLPYALDLISLALGAGATFTEALRTVVREHSDDPLNAELKAVLAEIELGATRRKALQNLAQRVPLENMQSIVASVVQAEDLGTPLHSVLHDQATLLRLQRSVHAEGAAATASVKILIPCLLIVVAVILAIFGPSIIRGLHGGMF